MMAGKIGAKQQKRLSNNEIIFLKKILGERFVISYKEIKIVEKYFGIFWRAIKRRAKVSNFKIESGYSWNELQELESFKTKRYLWFNCINCGCLVQTVLGKFLFRKKHIQVCKKHYFEKYVFTKEWRDANSKAQLISQNKPEVIEKHRNNSRQMWINGGDTLRLLVATKVKARFLDPAYREMWSKKSSEKWQNPLYREKQLKATQAKNGITDDGLKYASLAEFAFVLWQKSLNRVIKRYDGSGIEYKLDDGSQHRYYPDFIIENCIIEVKGEYWYGLHKDVVDKKSEACKEYCKSAGLYYRLVFQRDIPNKFRIAAKALHEVKKKNN